MQKQPATQSDWMTNSLVLQRLIVDSPVWIPSQSATPSCSTSDVAQSSRVLKVRRRQPHWSIGCLSLWHNRPGQYDEHITFVDQYLARCLPTAFTFTDLAPGSFQVATQSTTNVIMFHQNHKYASLSHHETHPKTARYLYNDNSFGHVRALVIQKFFNLQIA